MLELDDIQHILLMRVPALTGRYEFLSFRNATGGRAWVIKPNEADIKKIYKPGEWTDMAVSAHGKRLVVHLNGKKTAELKNDKGRLEGHLALQLHGNQDMEVHYKDLQILSPAK